VSSVNNSSWCPLLTAADLRRQVRVLQNLDRLLAHADRRPRDYAPSQEVGERYPQFLRKIFSSRTVGAGRRDTASGARAVFETLGYKKVPFARSWSGIPDRRSQSRFFLSPDEWNVSDSHCTGRFALTQWIFAAVLGPVIYAIAFGSLTVQVKGCWGRTEFCRRGLLKAVAENGWRRPVFFVRRFFLDQFSDGPRLVRAFAGRAWPSRRWCWRVFERAGWRFCLSCTCR